MKKTTLKNILFLMFGFLTYSISAQTFYYEDFRFENEGRGFTVQKVALGGQTASAVGKRVGDVVDATDSSPVFDESNRPAIRVPNGGIREQRTIAFNNTSGTAPNITNYEIEAWAFMTNQDLSSANMAKVSFWTQQRFIVGGGATLTIWVSENYTHGSLPSTATWTNETANITGNIATSDVSPQTFVNGSLDLSAYKGTSVTIAFKVVSDNSAYQKDVKQHGTFYISDVKFTAERQDVANGAFSALNTSSSGQTGVFNTPSAAIAESNFSNTTRWANIFTSDASTPRLGENILMPTNEGYKFEIADKYNPVAVTEVRYILANGTSNKGAPDESKWIVQGSNDDNTWDDLSSPLGMLSNNSGAGTEFPITLTTAKPYRYYRLVLSTAWTPNQKFTALHQLDFTVDNTILSTKNNELNDAFTVYPNPTSNLINISKSNVEIKNVKLIDVTGKVIYKSSNAQPINVRNFSKGLYILKIESKNGAVASKKVVIN